MFLQNKPNSNVQNDEETNENIINNNMISMGIYELPISVTSTNLTIDYDISYKYSVFENNIILKKNIENPDGGITIKLNAINANYTIFTPQRLHFICNDLKYLNKHVEIKK
jgi:hypothetical protein